MKALLPTESRIEGKWILVGQTVLADEACEQIEYLVSKILKKLAVSKEYGDWETLYQDPADGRFWEKTYPQSEMHGGGPPLLEVIAADEAKRKYAIK